MKILIFIIFFLALKNASLKQFNADEVFLNENQQSGFLEINTNSSLFYWLFRSQQSPDADPLMISLTGGPGCSSEGSIFNANGPYRIQDDLTLTKNPFSWNIISNVLFVDQPVGVGYSQTDAYDTTQLQYSSQFYTFLTKFLDQFPEFKKRDLYFYGPSYGGKFVPNIVYYMLQQNNSDINLKGLTLADGWVDPLVQIQSYPQFALQNKIISKTQSIKYNLEIAQLQNFIKTKNYTEAFAMIGQTVFNITNNFDPYNIKKPNSVYAFDSTSIFLSQEQIQQYLNTTNIQWQECSNQVLTALTDDFFTNVSDKVAYILDAGIKISTYNGNLDFICNWIGGLSWVKQINWKYKNQFNSQKLIDWTPTNNQSIVLGQIQQFENLQFIKFYNAGHYGTADVPQTSFYQLKELINLSYDFQQS